MAGGTKKTVFGIIGIVVIIVAAIVIYFNLEPSVTKVESAPSWTNVARYENTDFGFSIQYDADVLTKDSTPKIPGFVFSRTAEKGYPLIGTHVGKYPEGKTFEEIIPSAYKSLQAFFPKGKIHGVDNEGHLVLKDGTEAFYYEIRLFSGKEELVETVVMAKEFGNLITVYGFDYETGDINKLKAQVQTLALDVEIDFAALKAKGVAESGRLIRTAKPSFSMEYPKTFQELPLQQGQIFRVGIQGGTPVIGIGFYTLETDKKAEDQIKGYGPYYAKILENVGTDLELVSNKKIKNYKGYPAYQFVVKWKFQGQYPLLSVGHVIAKEGDGITFIGHTSGDINPVLEIFKSINLNP